MPENAVSSQRLSHPLRLATLFLGIGLVSYWLLADTVRHYLPGRRNPHEIRVSYWGSYTDHRMWGRIIAAFEKTSPDLHVRPEWLPLSGYAAKIDQQFVAGDAPDVILFQDEPFPRYAAEQFVDLTELLARDPETRRRLADCWPTAVASFMFHGDPYGIPINGGNVLIYCNLEAFERAGHFHGRRITPPRTDWTIQEFVALARQLTIDTNGDGRTDQFGFLQPHWVYYLPFIWSQGARLLDPARRRWVFRGPAAIAAVTLYADLHDRYRVTPAPIQYAGQNSDTAFLSGRVAMCVNGPWFQPFLNQTSLRDRYCVVNIPAGPGGSATRVTWDGLCIYANLPPGRKANAWRFVRFVLTRQAQEVFAGYQRAIPARRASAEAYIREGGGADSPAAAFVRTMKTGRLQPITPAWQAMHRAIQKHFNSVILDGSARRSPDEALKALAEDRNIVSSFESEP